MAPRKTAAEKKVQQAEERKAPEPVTLIAAHRFGTYPYENPIRQMTWDPVAEMNVMVETKPGRLVKADEFMVQSDTDEVEVLRASGLMKPDTGPLWLANDPNAPAAAGGRGVTSGMVQTDAQAAAVQPPTVEWETQNEKEIGALIEAGDIHDLYAALNWETAHQVRPGIVRLLADAMAEGETEGDLAATVG